MGGGRVCRAQQVCAKALRLTGMQSELSRTGVHVYEYRGARPMSTFPLPSEDVSYYTLALKGLRVIWIKEQMWQKSLSMDNFTLITNRCWTLCHKCEDIKFIL